MSTYSAGRWGYRHRDVTPGNEAPWLRPVMPSWRAFWGTCAGVAVLGLPFGLGLAVTGSLLLTGMVFGLCALVRREIKVCPGCYESVADGAHRCRCGFHDGMVG